MASKNQVPNGAVQGLANVVSITLTIEGHERTVANLRRERQRLLYEASRLGATYEVLAKQTKLRPSTVATEIQKYREDNACGPLPRGRRRGFSPKVKEPSVA